MCHTDLAVILNRHIRYQSLLVWFVLKFVLMFFLFSSFSFVLDEPAIKSNLTFLFANSQYLSAPSSICQRPLHWIFIIHTSVVYSRFSYFNLISFKHPPLFSSAFQVACVSLFHNNLQFPNHRPTLHLNSQSSRLLGLLSSFRLHVPLPIVAGL